MTMETAVVTAANPDTFEENGVPPTKKASLVVKDGPSFNELQSIERHRREILLRVSLFNIAVCLCTCFAYTLYISVMHCTHHIMILYRTVDTLFNSHHL